MGSPFTRDENQILRNKRKAEIEQFNKDLQQQIADKKRFMEESKQKLENKRKYESSLRSISPIKRIDTCVAQHEREVNQNPKIDLGKTTEQRLNIGGLEQIVEQPLNKELESERYHVLQFQIEVCQLLHIESE